MKAPTYTTKALSSGKIAVHEINVYYPRGKVIGIKLNSQAGADLWIARQVAENDENRRAKIADYLAERAARVPAIVEPSNQLEMFA